MRAFTKFAASVAVTLLATSAASAATVVNFSGLNYYTSLSAGKPVYSESGVTFTVPGYGLANGGLHGFAITINSSTTITVTPQAGGSSNEFDFISEEFSEANDVQPVDTVNFVGTKANGTTVTGFLTLPADSTAIETFAPSNFTGLISLTYKSGFANFQNFTFNPATVYASAVPEPATWAMMLVGMGAIGFAARRRRNVRVTYA